MEKLSVSFYYEMPRASKRFTEWLAKQPEKEYFRIVYFGKLQVTSSGSGGSEKNNSALELEEMMDEIWKDASIQYKLHKISGHLSYTNKF